jgi:hypothetical protein
MVFKSRAKIVDLYESRKKKALPILFQQGYV